MYTLYRISDVRVVIQRKIGVFGKKSKGRNVKTIAALRTSEKEINLSLLV